jgi:hypothetical protein
MSALVLSWIVSAAPTRLHRAEEKQLQQQQQQLQRLGPTMTARRLLLPSSSSSTVVLATLALARASSRSRCFLTVWAQGVPRCGGCGGCCATLASAIPWHSAHEPAAAAAAAAAAPYGREHTQPNHVLSPRLCVGHIALVDHTLIVRDQACRILVHLQGVPPLVPATSAQHNTTQHNTTQHSIGGLRTGMAAGEGGKAGGWESGRAGRGEGGRTGAGARSLRTTAR